MNIRKMFSSVVDTHPQLRVVKVSAPSEMIRNFNQGSQQPQQKTVENAFVLAKH